MKNLSDAEQLIMRIIWNEGGRIFLNELMKHLALADKNWKANTVLTFLSRLAEKDMLKIEKYGRLNVYVAIVTEAEFAESQTQSFISKIFDGDAKSLVASLMRLDCLTTDDLTELQEFWKGTKENAK